MMLCEIAHDAGVAEELAQIAVREHQVEMVGAGYKQPRSDLVMLSVSRIWRCGPRSIRGLLQGSRHHEQSIVLFYSARSLTA